MTHHVVEGDGVALGGLRVRYDEWRARHRATLARHHGGELRFADAILRPLDGSLDFSHVCPQHPFTDLRGRRRYLDFLIDEPDGARIAIEVDGFDKRNTGGMSRSDFEDFLERERAVTLQGWPLLRFSNTLVSHYGQTVLGL